MNEVHRVLKVLRINEVLQLKIRLKKSAKMIGWRTPNMACNCPAQQRLKGQYKMKFDYLHEKGISYLWLLNREQAKSSNKDKLGIGMLVLCPIGISIGFVERVRVPNQFATGQAVHMLKKDGVKREEQKEGHQ